MTILDEYRRVTQADTFANRAGRGTMSIVRELDDGIVEKSDRPDDVPLVAANSSSQTILRLLVLFHALM